MKSAATESALREFLVAFKTHAPVLEQLQLLLTQQQQSQQSGTAAITAFREAFFERLAELRAGQTGAATAAAKPQTDESQLQK